MSDLTKIGRGTTPTIRITFSEIDTDDITDAYLTLKQGETTVEKDLEDADVGSGYIDWELTQAETLGFASDTINMIEIQCRWKTEEVVGQTEIVEATAGRILKGGEI